MRRIDLLVVLLALSAFVALTAGMALSAPPRPSRPAALPTLPAGEAPRTLVEGAVGPLLTLDPLAAGTPAERAVVALLFRGLGRLAPDGRVAPDLAAGWEVDEAGGTWTVHLQPAERWHDGVLVTADDVVATVGALTDPAFAGDAGAAWQGVEVERVDRFTVRFELPVAIAGFASALLTPLIPAHHLGGLTPQERADDQFATAPVGNGPYRLERLGADGARLARVGDRPGGPSVTFAPGIGAPVPEPTPRTAGRRTPWFDQVMVRPYADEAALGRAVAAGEVHLAGGLGAAARADLGGDVRQVRYPGTRVLALVPNLRFSTEPLRDPAVRRALSTAIDRTLIAEAAFGGAAVPVRTPIPPGHWLWDPATSGVPAPDPTAARAALLAAGWTEGPGGWIPAGAPEPVTIELLVPDAEDDPGLLLTGEGVAEAWRAIGIGVDVVTMDPRRIVSERLEPGDFDVVLLAIDVGLDPDLYPHLLSTEAVVGGTNLSGYGSTLMDRLLDEARRPADGSTRAIRSRALQAALLREMPIIPLVFPDHVVVVSSGLAGPSPALVPRAEGRYWDVLAWRAAPDTGE